MAELVRILNDCDGFRAPYGGSERLCRFRAGSELTLLRDDDQSYYKVAYGGVPLFVAKAASERTAGADGVTPIAVRLPVDAAAGIAVEPIAAPASPRAPYVAREPARRGGWVQTTFRVLGVLLGLNLAATGVALAIAAAPGSLGVGSGAGDAYGLGIGGGFLIAGGLGVIWISYRPLFQFALAFAGLAAVIGGIELLIFAIPLSRMSPLDIETERVGSTLVAAGAALIAVGLAAMGLPLVRWARNAESRGRWPDIARWAAIVYGALLTLGGPGLATSAAARSEEFRPTLEDAGLIGAAVSLSLVPGALLLFHGVTMRGRIGARPFRLPAAAWLFAAFAVAVALGAIVVEIGDPVIWLMTVAHAAAGLLPAIALLALVSRGGPGWSRPAAGLSHRQLGLAFAVGVVVVTTVAGTLDGLIVQALSTAFLAANGAFDGVRGRDLGDVLADTESYLSRGQEAALLVLVVVAMAPIMEEGFKAMGIALVLPRRPTPSAALMLGVAVGGGFGVFEASVYGLASLDSASEVDWWALMLVRAGATSMHSLNTGMLGLALYYGRAEGRYRRAFLLYLAAVASHALWNGLAVLAGTRVIFEFQDLTDRQVAALAFGLMAPLALGTFALLYTIARKAYRESPKVPDEQPRPTFSTPLSAYEPWLG